MLLVAAGFGTLIGLSIGMVGGGGSVLAVPVLVYVLGQSVHQATTASLVVVTAAALAGGARHARSGRVCWRHALTFSGAALPGIAGGTALAEQVGGSALIGAFGVVMLIAGAATWRRAARVPGEARRREEALCPPLQLARDGAAGLVVGAMTGFFGVGGGFLIVPALAIFLSLSMRLAVGTSLAVVTATSLLGLGAHLVAGRGLDLDVTLTMAAGAVAGAVAGAALAGRVPQRQLGQGFAAFVTLIALYLVVSAAFLGGPPGS